MTDRPLPGGTLSRAADEQTLTVLDMRRQGLSTRQIAARVGRVQQSIHRTCATVADADMAHHDPHATPADYRKAYPWIP
jgi:IS30 family transposase